MYIASRSSNRLSLKRFDPFTSLTREVSLHSLSRYRTKGQVTCLIHVYLPPFSCDVNGKCHGVKEMDEEQRRRVRCVRTLDCRMDLSATLSTCTVRHATGDNERENRSTPSLHLEKLATSYLPATKGHFT